MQLQTVCLLMNSVLLKLGRNELDLLCSLANNSQNGSHDFFHIFSIIFLNYLIKNHKCPHIFDIYY